MNSDDKALMEKFGITAETKTTFHFRGYRYQRLSDAVSYAKQNPRPAQKSTIEHEN